MSQIARLLDQAVEAYAAHDHARAVEYCEAILNADPKHVRAHTYRALASLDRLLRELKDAFSSLSVMAVALQQPVGSREKREYLARVQQLRELVGRGADAFVTSLGRALDLDKALFHEFPPSTAEDYRSHWREGIGKCLNAIVSVLVKLDENDGRAMQREVVALEKRFEDLTARIAEPPDDLPPPPAEMTAMFDGGDDDGAGAGMMLAGVSDEAFPTFDLSNVSPMAFADDSAELQLMNMGDPDESTSHVPIDSAVMLVKYTGESGPTMHFSLDEEALADASESDDGPSVEEVAEQAAMRAAQKMLEEERQRIDAERKMVEQELQAAKQQLLQAEARARQEAEAAASDRARVKQELDEARERMRAAEHQAKKEAAEVRQRAEADARAEVERAKKAQQDAEVRARHEIENLRRQAEIDRLKAEKEALARGAKEAAAAAAQQAAAAPQMSPEQFAEMAGRIARQIVEDYHSRQEARGHKAARELTPEDVARQVAVTMAQEVGSDDAQTVATMSQVVAQSLPRDLVEQLGIGSGGFLGKKSKSSLPKGPTKMVGRSSTANKKAPPTPGASGLRPGRESHETIEVTSDDVHTMSGAGTVAGASAIVTGERQSSMSMVQAAHLSAVGSASIATKPGGPLTFDERSASTPIDTPEGQLLLGRLREAYAAWVNARPSHPFPQAPAVMQPKSLTTSTLYGFQMVILFESRTLRTGEAVYRDEPIAASPLTAGTLNPWSCQADLPVDFLNRQAVYRLPETFTHAPGSDNSRLAFLELHQQRTPQVEMLVWPREQSPAEFQLLGLFTHHRVKRREVFEPFLRATDVERLFPAALHPLIRRMAQSLRAAESDTRKIRALSVAVREVAVHRLTFTLPGAPEYSSRRAPVTEAGGSGGGESPQTAPGTGVAGSPAAEGLREFRCAFVELMPDGALPTLRVAPEVDIALDHERQMRDDADWSARHGRSNRTARITKQLLTLDPSDRQAQKLQHLVYRRARTDYTLGFVLGVVAALAIVFVALLKLDTALLMAATPLILVAGALVTFGIWHAVGVRLGSRPGRLLLATLLVAGIGALAPAVAPKWLNIWWLDVSQMQADAPTKPPAADQQP